MDIKRELLVAAGGGIATLNVSVSELAEQALARIQTLERNLKLADSNANLYADERNELRKQVTALEEVRRTHSRHSD